MFLKATAFCPVCDDTLGYIVKGEVCSFVCKECRWIFTWDRDGKLSKPVKLEDRKTVKCDCGGCQARDERKYLKK